MFSFLKKTRASARSATVNGVAIPVTPGQTLLHAALQANIDFPHSCRVGGCAACKCRLLSGRVKELTDLGYILSDEELDKGYILACQSVPASDIAVEVDLSRRLKRKQVAARVIQQQPLTHDITRLKLQLQDALDYRAGQFADLCFSALPGVSRSYSFATPPTPDATVSFFVRAVPGGALSTVIQSQNLMGQAVTLSGPEGDFWLRDADAPMLLIAGGSGLAPILAILQAALGNQDHRPATLLFGARTQQDLYALDDIATIASQWRAPFTFTPVLSGEAPDSPWRGARGLVTDVIPDLELSGAHAYLCGPPVMIDIAEQLLISGGVERRHIHADRFTTSADAIRPHSASLHLPTKPTKESY